jgi:hypothetical protein
MLTFCLNRTPTRCKHTRCKHMHSSWHVGGPTLCNQVVIILLIIAGTAQNSSRTIRRAFKANNLPRMYDVEVPVKNERAKPLPRVEPLRVPVVLPSDLLRWMWSSHPAQFEQRILGSKSAPLNFWQQIRESDEVWVHPGLADKTQLHMCVPWTVHGDGVPFRKQGAGSTSLQVISHSSLTGHGPTIDTHFLFCGIPNDIVVKPDKGRGNLTSDPLWEVLMWDLESCMQGTYPRHDENGEPWPPNSERALLAGEPICGGYKIIHIQNRGDLDWHCNETCLQHWSSNEPCFRCTCSKRDVFDWDSPWVHGGHGRAHPEHPLFKPAGFPQDFGMSRLTPLTLWTRGSQNSRSDHCSKPWCSTINFVAGTMSTTSGC